MLIKFVVINDYAGLQNNLKNHATPAYGDESIQDEITSFTQVTGRQLLQEKTRAADLKEKLSQGTMLNLNTMMAAVM